MIIVAGHLTVDPNLRDAYLKACVPAVEQARSTPGCADFAVSADVVDPARVNVYERWESQDDVDAFRAGGPEFVPPSPILGADVVDYTVTGQQAAR